MWRVGCGAGGELDAIKNDLNDIKDAGDFNVTRGGDWAVVGRTYLRGPKDLSNMRRIQDEYLITPLSKVRHPVQPRRPKKIIKKSTDATIPGTQPGEDPLAFYAALGKEMLKFPAPAADRALLAQLREVGVGPRLILRTRT